jgi:hypothetical protein
MSVVLVAVEMVRPASVTYPAVSQAAGSAVVASVGSAVPSGANQARTAVPPWPEMPARTLRGVGEGTPAAMSC